MHESDHLDRRQELVLFDPMNPRAISQLMPEAFAQAMRALWSSDDAPHLLGINEVGLLRELHRRKKDPAPLDYKIRLKFWVEFERVQSLRQVQKMHMANILGNDFAKDTFYRFYITDPCRLAFLICRPQNYEHALDMVLNQSLLKIAEFINAMDPNDTEERENWLNKLLQVQRDLSNRKMAFEFRSRRPQGRPRNEVDEPDETEVPLPEVEKSETVEERLARVKAETGKTEVLPGQVV